MSTDPLAPHVDPRWRDAFVMELRLRDVPGRAIGDTLAELDTHCADADQDAATAFGDPVAYAREVAAHHPTRRSLPLRDGAAIVVQTAGLMGIVWSVPPWVHGDPLVLSGGMTVTAVATLVAAIALCAAPAPVLRRLARARWWQAALAGATVTAGLAALAALAPEGGLTAPAMPFALVSLALAAIGGVSALATGGASDPVVAPGTDDAAQHRRARRTAIVLHAGLPVLALLVGGLLTLLPR